jgi:two-component system sensor histidine kinase RegB
MLTHALPKSEISARDNLKWLFILRNLMIACEAFIILLCVYGLQIPLPQDSLWLTVIAIGAANVYTWLRLQTDSPVSEQEIFAQLTLDVFGIAVLLYLTGGATNPIIWIFLLPVILTGIILPHDYTWYMVILTTSLYTALIAFHAPLPSIEPNIVDTDMHHHLQALSEKHYLNLHIFGMWFGFVLSAGIVAYFVVELSNTLRERERNLADARAEQLRNERVVALGTLAASAAHDMGTPLGTIAIILHELQQTLPEHRFPDLVEKMRIMQNQIDRCKAALSLMSASAGELRAESGQLMAIGDYMDSVLNQWRAQKPDIKLDIRLEPQQPFTSARIVADKTLTHSLINILNNAAEVSPKDQGIEFHICWNETHANIKIRDFGPGLRQDIIEMAGKEPISTKKHGLGVGLFLTYATINRLGGKINIYNMADGGACIDITLPLLPSEDQQ